MDQELTQCLLVAVPAFVAQMEDHRRVYTIDLNLVERFIMRAELLLELLRVLTGTLAVSTLLA